jgi:cold shock CspA family protein
MRRAVLLDVSPFAFNRGRAQGWTLGHGPFLFEVGIMRGTITSIKAHQGFAFIRGEDKQDYFFHRTTNIELFDEMVRGDAVTFEGQSTQRGLRASQVERG